MALTEKQKEIARNAINANRAAQGNKGTSAQPKSNFGSGLSSAQRALAESAVAQIVNRHEDNDLASIAANLGRDKKRTTTRTPGVTTAPDNIGAAALDDAMGVARPTAKTAKTPSTYNPYKSYNQPDGQIAKGEAKQTTKAYSDKRMQDEALRLFKEYGGKSYTEIQEAIAQNTGDDYMSQYQKQILTQIGQQNRTRADIEREIAETEAELEIAQAEWDRISNDVTTTYGGGNAEEYNAATERVNELTERKKTLKGELWTYDQNEMYSAIPGYSDFGKNSGVTGDGKGRVYHFINDTYGEKSAMAEGRIKPGQGADASFMPYLYMTDDEIGVYNYLYNVSGKEAADQYLDYLEFSLNERNQQAIYDRSFKNASRNFGTKVAASIASIPANLASGVGYLDVLGQRAQRVLTGSDKPIDYNRNAQSAYNFAQGAREGTMSGMSDTGKFIYSTAMSMGDSLGVLGISLLTGGSGATMLLGGSAATSTMHEAKANGASDGQALAMGFIAGAAETIMEELPLEKLLNITPASNWVEFIQNSIKQGANEATEEVLTTLVNTAADVLIMGDKNALMRSYEKYLAQGYTPEEAERLAKNEWWLGLAGDAFAGFLSGGMFGAGGTAIKSVNQRADRADRGKGISTSEYTLPLLIDHVEKGYTNRDTKVPLQYSEETKKTAEKIKSDLAAGKTVSNAQKGKLAEQILKDNAEFNEKVLPGILLEAQNREDAAAAQKDEISSEKNEISSEQDEMSSKEAAPKRNIVQTIRERLQKRADAKAGANNVDPAAAKILAQEVLNDESTYSKKTRAAAERIMNGETVNNADSQALVSGIKADNVDFSGYTAEEIIAEASVLAQEEAEQSAGAETTAETKTAVPQSTAQQTTTEGAMTNDQRTDGTGNEQRSTEGDTTRADRGRGRFSETYSGDAAPVSAGSRDVGAAKSRAQTAGERQNKVADLRIEPTSAASVGINGGSEDATMYIIPEDAYDEELRSIAEDAKANGVTVHFFTGVMPVNNSYANASVSGNEMYVRADSAKYTAAELYDHEKFHKIFRGKPGLITELYNWIRNKYTAESFDDIIDTYYDKYNDVYGFDEMSADEALRIVLEEIFADAYAGTNKFGAGATEYTAPTRAAADAMGATSSEYNANQGRAPPQGMTYDDVKQAVREVMSEVMGIEGNKNTAEDGGAKFALASTLNPNMLDPKTITRKDVLEMLNNVLEGKYYDNTYIPIRINTPSVLIESAKTVRGDVIDNNPIAISALKAYQAMARSGEDVNGRPHKFEPEDIIAIVEEMNNPEYIVYQGVNGRYVEVVNYGTKKGENAIAVLEIGEYKPNWTMNGFEQGLYNILVTTYPPDSGVVSKLLTTKTNEVIYRKKNAVSRGTPGSTVPSVSNDKAFYDNSMPETTPNVKQQFAISDEMDSEYLDAVERGDMEAAQQMVDDAARMAGWIPEDAYHGTGQFGFTSFDPEMSDDKMSIFLSSSSGVSSTYSGGGTVRQISQKSEIAPEELDKASPEKVLELLRKYINPNIEMLDEKERETVIKDNQKHIENAIEMAVALPEILGDRWNAGAQAYLNDVIKFLKEMATANTYDEFMSANMEYEAALWEMKWEDEHATSVLVELLGDDVRNAYLGLTNYLGLSLYKGNAEYTQKHHRKFFNINEAQDELRGVMFKGIYRLYTKPGKQLVIDANGGYWNQIDGKHIEESGPVRTRDVAKYAKEKGYDSVRIKNLRDSADYSYVAPSDVFIFFDGARLKSADTVTYDDDGNIIPLSERFNSDKNDIRFAISDEYDVAPEDRTWADTGDRKFNSYAFDHPELRPYFKEAARAMFYDLLNSVKGERWSTTSDSKNWTGSKRSTTENIARLLDNGHMTYQRIQEALLTMLYKAEDGKAMNRADVKKVELEIDTMLQEGYTDPTGLYVEPNREYRRLLDAIKSGYGSVEEADAAYEAEVRDEAYEARVEADVWEGYDQRADEMYDDVYSAYEPGMEAYEDISQEDRDYLGEIVESADELRLQRMADEKLRAAEELDEENEALRLRNMEYAEEANNYFDAYNYEELENERRRMDAVMQSALQNPDISAAPDTSAEHWESISAQLIEEKRRQKRENAVAEAENNDMYLPDGVSDAEILAAQEKYREQMAARKAADEAKYEGLTAEEAEAAKEADARRAQAEYLEGVDRKNFVGSEAMEKLKIKISRSIANYKSSAGLIERAKANAALVREMDKAIQKMHPSEEEKYFATGIMNNDLSEYSIPSHLDAERVLELADYMVARKAGRTDLFAAQKADINNRNRQLASDKFKNAEKAKRVKLIKLNYMTPRRAMIEMFGQEQGEEIYRTFFAPVRTNDAERIRFAERLRQEALEIVGADGKKGKLTKEERALTQMLMEGKAAGEMLAKMETGGKERIEAAAKRILKGEPLREENGRYVVGEEGADELSAKEADIARRHAAYTQAQEAIRTGTFDKKKVDGTRINNAAKHFAQQYDMLYDAINEFLVAHGEQPIGFIKGYAPHLQAEGAMKPLERLLQWMGAPTDITDLRAEIAGETHNRKPNRKWNPHFLSRTVGSETEYDVYKGFEEYVDYISEVFYHMDDIMRLRAASRYLRTAYTTEDSKNQLRQIEEVRNGGYYEKMNFLLANNKIARGVTLIGAEIDEALDKYVDEILNEEENKTAVKSSLVMWLDNYANLLAGKQNAMDRGLEQQIERKGIRATNKAVNLLISAQVVGNLSSALNQMAQLPMTLTELGADNVSKALWDLVRHSGEMRRWSTENDFLVARKGTTILNYQITDKLTNGLAKPLEIADYFMSSITARAAYHQALKQGMDVENAMQYSVQKSEDIMGSRNKASKPVAFSTKNPIMRLVNAYQIEVLNQWQHIIKDLPREYKSIAQSRGKWAAAGRIAKDLVLYLILAALINRIAEETYGGTPAPLDLLGIVGNFAASGNGLTLNEGIVRVINSMTGKMFGKEWLKENHTFDSEMPDEFDWGAAWEDTAYTLSSEIPFLNNIMAVAGLTDDETVFAAGINDAKESFFGKKGEGGAIDHFFVTRREREEGEQESAEVLDGLYDVAMGISEFLMGGRQLQKTIQGVVTLSGGGEKNSSGNLMYPVADTVGNWIKGTLFGKTALENSRAYYASGAAALSGTRNEQYYFMVENGIDEETAYGVAQGLADVGDKFRDQMEYIMNTELPDETKNGLAFSVASEAAYDRYVSYDLESEGIEPAEFMFAWAFYQSATGEDTAGQTEDFLRQQGVSERDIAKIIAALKKKK